MASIDNNKSVFVHIGTNDRDKGNLEPTFTSLGLRTGKYKQGVNNISVEEKQAFKP